MENPSSWGDLERAILAAIDHVNISGLHAPAEIADWVCARYTITNKDRLELVIELAIKSHTDDVVNGIIGLSNVMTVANAIRKVLKYDI